MSFLRPKVQQVAPPPPPVIEDAQAKAQEQADILRRRRGRASAVLTQGGQAGQPQTAAKVLLGG